MKSESTATAVAEQNTHVAPEATSPKMEVLRKKVAAKGHKRAQGAGGNAAPTKKRKARANGKSPKSEQKADAPRAESKSAKILALIGRPKGATLTEIMKAAQWQAHSVRGFISTAGKKQKIKIESATNEAGDRVYKSGK